MAAQRNNVPVSEKRGPVAAYTRPSPAPAANFPLLSDGLEQE
ncbi:MAG TPA: hypothetical protein VNL73_03270 [Verrucomicrobiae bacterium]|nr:hypothetical protein [Verrucomicrobiae bacterium]